MIRVLFWICVFGNEKAGVWGPSFGPSPVAVVFSPSDRREGAFRDVEDCLQVSADVCPRTTSTYSGTLHSQAGSVGYASSPILTEFTVRSTFF